MDTVKILQLIKTTLTRKGTGKGNNPVRIITQYWSMEGQLIFEIDPYLQAGNTNNTI